MIVRLSDNNRISHVKGSSRGRMRYRGRTESWKKFWVSIEICVKAKSTKWFLYRNVSQVKSGQTTARWKTATTRHFLELTSTSVARARGTSSFPAAKTATMIKIFTTRTGLIQSMMPLLSRFQMHNMYYQCNA